MILIRFLCAKLACESAEQVMADPVLDVDKTVVELMPPQWGLDNTDGGPALHCPDHRGDVPTP